jgi:hypothetical protein
VLEREIKTEARLRLYNDPPCLKVVIGTMTYSMSGPISQLRRVMEAAADRLDVEVEVQDLKEPSE